MTGDSSFIPGPFDRTTSAVLPPSRRAAAMSFVADQSIAASLATVNEFHFTGYSLPRTATTPSRCAGVTAGSNVNTAQSIWPFEKSPPRSPETQNFAPSGFVAPYDPRFTRKALLNLQ